MIIATYNRLPELQTVLASLLPPVQRQPVEVVIVADCSTGATWERLQGDRAATPGVLCLRMEKNSGPGPARNLGLLVAQGEYFVLVYSDCVVVARAIERILLAVHKEHTSDPATLRAGGLRLLYPQRQS